MNFPVRSKISALSAFVLATVVLPVLSTSCTNDPREVDALADAKKIPPTVIDSFSMVRSDSGLVVMRMRAAQVVMEPDPQTPTLVDRKASGGVEIIMYYPGTDQVRAHMTSRRAIEHAASGLSEALGDVIVANGQGDTIRTERLLWDRRKHIFYTDRFARIVREGDVMMPRKGFEADENFGWYNLFNSQGDISIEDSLSRVDPIQTE